MKLLFDENLSFRLVGALADVYPGSAHVRDVGLLGAEDRRILTSKDTDFYQISVTFGAPPKVIWLRVGNVSTAQVSNLLRQRYLLVRRSHDDPTATILPLALT